MAVSNVEKSGSTEWVGLESVVAVKMPSTFPAAKMRPGHYFDFTEQNDNVLHRNFTTHDFSRRRTRSTLFIVRVGGLVPVGPGFTGRVGGGSMLVRNG